jgi:hypothetical protein
MLFAMLNIAFRCYFMLGRCCFGSATTLPDLVARGQGWGEGAGMAKKEGFQPLAQRIYWV